MPMVQIRDPRGSRRSVSAARPIDSENCRVEISHTHGRVPVFPEAGFQFESRRARSTEDFNGLVPPHGEISLVKGALRDWAELGFDCGTKLRNLRGYESILRCGSL